MTRTRKSARASHADQDSSDHGAEEVHNGATQAPDVYEPTEEESTIRILIASDNHIGYAERDPVRGNDSFDSFREVMEIAKEEDVDMVLLAGDLFHDNKPSRKSMYQAMRSLRLNCLGDKPCELEVLGDQSVATEDTAVMHINYEDPEINVAIPVFSIHGNHDDPSGEGRLCALDILQVAGLLNYYGRVPESDDITVKPVLLQKGTTKLALYGLSNVRDERLHRSFRHNKVKFMRPELYQDEWFNLIAVHQNHHGHSETNYLPENFLQNFFDFVVWGHEHECLIDPILNPEQDFHVCQPGSSVATSLCAGEAVAKHVGVLSIRDRSFKMRKIRLKTPRPFVMHEISLSDHDDLIDPRRENKSEVIAFLMSRIEEAILEANEEWRASRREDDDDHDDEEEAAREPPLPLIRLRVDYSSAVGSYEIENPQRFSQRFLGRVANASDVVQFYLKKKKVTKSGSTTRRAGGDTELERPDLGETGLTGLKVSALVRQYLAKQTLQCLPENELGDAVTQYVEKDDKDAIKDFVADHHKSQVRLMTGDNTTEQNLNEAIKRSRETMASQFEARQARLEAARLRRQAEQVSDLDSDGDAATSHVATKKRKAAPVRGAASPVTTTKKKKAPAKSSRKRAISEDERDSEEQELDGSVDEQRDIDAIMSDESEERASPPPPPVPKTRVKAAPKARVGAATRKAVPRQAQLSFTSTPATRPERRSQEPSISISSDEDDGFKPPPPKRRR